MAIKLFVFDIDGTLTIKGREIPFNLQNTLRAMQRSGKLCTVATGNSYIQFLLKYGAQFVPNTYMILENGARIGDIYEKYLFQDELSQDILDATDYIIENNDLLYIGYYRGLAQKYTFYTKEKELYPSLGYMTDEIIFDKSKFIKKINDLKPARIVFGIKSGEVILPVDYKANCIPNMNTYEVTNLGTTKGESVKILAKKLGLGMEDIAVIGNGYNDIALFELDVSTKIYVGDECPPLEKLSTDRLKDAIELGDFLIKYI